MYRILWMYEGWELADNAFYSSFADVEEVLNNQHIPEGKTMEVKIYGKDLKHLRTYSFDHGKWSLPWEAPASPEPNASF